MTTLLKLESMGDREIQSWLRKVPPFALAVALIGARPASKDRVLKNMSDRASRMLSESVRRYSAMDAKELLIQKSADELEALMNGSKAGS
jgi:flagellar motor switch protein FliG